MPLTTSTTQAQSQRIMDDLSNVGFAFRLNELTHLIEVNGTPLTDETAAAIRTCMRDLGYRGMASIEDAYKTHAMHHSYHPIRDYFDGLQWDGRCHIAQLASHFGDSGPVFADGQSWFYHAFRRWLVGYVARVYEHTQLPMLVLEGPQRLGKSNFVSWLASILPEYFIEGPIAPDDKDSLIRLATSFLWEVSELGATVRKSDIEALKSFITLKYVTVRRSYGRFDTRMPAVAGLIGTLNDSGGFLNDSTGTRRALIIPLITIDWSYGQHVDLIHLWAEAVAAYKSKEVIELTSDERDVQAQINERFETVDPVTDLLNDRFEIDPMEAAWFTPSHEILETIDVNLKGTSLQHARSIAAACKKLGIESSRRRNGTGVMQRGYMGVRRRL